MRKLASLALLVLFVATLSLQSVASAASFKFAYRRVDNRYPCQNSVLVYSARVVSTRNISVKSALVTFTVHYKTTTTSYRAGYTNARGEVTKRFRIGMATPNYKVLVKSKAKKSGQDIVTSATWFKPQDCTP